MSVIKEMMEFNQSFVDNSDYTSYTTNKYPSKKLAILSCMDTRLTELLPAALNLKNGDTKIIKNAGAIISHPFGSVMRSLMVAVYELGVEEIMVIGHTDCGMQNMDVKNLINKMIARGVSKEKIDMVGYYGIDINKWFKGFDDVRQSVAETVNTIKEHPFIPKDINVYGFLMCPKTGKLSKVV